MRIGELAAATGLSRDALRFYEGRGLLTARRRGNGYRDYPPEAVEWLCYLRTAQSLGFTLADIDARIAGLAQLRAGLARRLAEPLDACPLRQPGLAA